MERLLRLVRWSFVFAPGVAFGCATQGSVADERPPVSPYTVAPPELSPVRVPQSRDAGTAMTTGIGPIGRLGLVRIVPTDERAVHRADKPPPPISGGTLLVSADGKLAVVSDPDRDRLSIVDLATRQLTATIALEAGDEPGRLVQDHGGLVHVALRRGGAVVSIDLATAAIVGRRAVCAAPRGIAYDQAADALRVACISGELVTLPAAAGSATTPWQLGPDLRDVVVQGGNLFVTVLKRAEIFHLDRRGTVTSTTSPSVQHASFPTSSLSVIDDTLQPEVARRTVAAPDGGLVMLHQGARVGAIDVSSAGEQNGPMAPNNPYGGASTRVDDFACAGVVRTELTRTDSSGQPVATAQVSGVLAVDVAVATDGTIALANAGARDQGQVFPGLAAPGSSPSSLPLSPFAPQIELFKLDSLQVGDAPAACAMPVNTIGLTGAQIVAVAYAPDGTLLAQSREPAALYMAPDPASTALLPIELGGASVYDTGHEIFHRDAGGGIACASCHAEGAEDGHVWQFQNIGPRRTQTLHVGLEGTAPFHWVGDMPNLGAIMEEVFVTRMGGVHESEPRTAALEAWVDSLTAPPSIRVARDPAAVRGRALFEGEARCSTCHNGPKLTNNVTVDVGKGLAVQVPALIGVGYRGPWLHDGCAVTLRDRFKPECGGSQHGDTAKLAAAQIDDLIAYLESL